MESVKSGSELATKKAVDLGNDASCPLYQVDSGYSSLDSSTTDSALPTVVVPEPIIVTHKTSGQETKRFAAQVFFFKKSQPELQHFPDTPVPDEFYTRFLDLIQLYDRPVKSKLKPKFMAWKVHVLGENENSKRPFIVILCDPGSTRKLGKFFSKKEVRRQCEDIENEPPLPVVIIPSAPVKVASSTPFVFASEFDRSVSDTTCGEIIKVVHNGEERMATIGGILKVVVGDEVALYGMTAGHVVDVDIEEGDLDALGFRWDEEDLEVESDSDDDDDDDDDDSSISKTNLAEPVRLYPIDLMPQTEDSRAWAKIGELLKPGVAIEGSKTYDSDWALVDITDQRRLRMNFVKEQHLPGNEKKHLPEIKSVSPGDCGSWVLDAETHAVYGHIVAVDIFDEAYVVPFEDATEHILRFFEADFVGLPSHVDFSIDQTLRTVKKLEALTTNPPVMRFAQPHKGKPSEIQQRTAKVPAAGSLVFQRLVHYYHF
ncbi:hypothetical protein ABW20_dc0101031 [Dactylellina cionopaga]|nr:hypothetical protein ABW20_dc0101031 [Dactylellina cionopaga]